MSHGVSLHLAARAYAWASLNIIVGSCAGSQLVHAVLVVSHVVVQLPREVLGHDRTHRRGELDTLVVERSDVGGHGVLEVAAGCHIHGVDKVCGLAVVVVEVEGQPVVEEAEVKTGVPCGGLLPCEVRVVNVRKIGHAVVAHWVEGVLCVWSVCGNPSVVANAFLLTCLTPTETELEVVDSLNVAEERLVVDAPSQGHRWEETPTAILVEARGTVVTQGEREHVPVQQGVVHAAEERHEEVLCLVECRSGV